MQNVGLRSGGEARFTLASVDDNLTSSQPTECQLHILQHILQDNAKTLTPPTLDWKKETWAWGLTNASDFEVYSQNILDQKQRRWLRHKLEFLVFSDHSFSSSPLLDALSPIFPITLFPFHFHFMLSPFLSSFFSPLPLPHHFVLVFLKQYWCFFSCQNNDINIYTKWQNLAHTTTD